LCGKELVYRNSLGTLVCYYCHEEFEANVACSEGHYICDKCHSSGAKDLIEQFCIQSDLTDPVKISEILMKHPSLKMHGPEHHFLVPAALLTAYYNIKGETTEKEKKIREAKKRSDKVLGGFCGFYGSCGAAMGAGIFMSLVTGATPVSKQEWALSNRVTARCLNRIADHGGPRCCKRNTWLAMAEAAAFTNEVLGVGIPVHGKVRCTFESLNKECRKEECPYNFTSQMT
jgi:hypothetical protein